MSTTKTSDVARASATMQGEKRTVGRRGFATGILGGALAAVVAGVAHAQPRVVMPGSGGTPPSQPAPVSSDIVAKVTPEMIAQAMNQVGYTDIGIKAPQKGGRYVLAKAGNTPVFVTFNCDLTKSQDGCEVLSFRVNLQKNPNIGWNYINAWNSQYVVSQLYRDGDGDLILRMGVVVMGGVTLGFLKTVSAQFAVLLKELAEFDPSKTS